MSCAARLSPTTAIDLAALAAPVASALEAVKARLAHLIPTNMAGTATTVYHQLLAAGGKRLRPLLTLLACAAAGGDPAQAVGLAAAIEVLHLSSLVHDDVIDEAEERRGRPSARQQWGNRAAVLVGDFLVAEVFWRLADDLGAEALTVLARAVATMCQAELNQDKDASDEERYMANIRGKTAVLIAAACEVGAMAAENAAARPVLLHYGQRLGEAFQICDDLLDLYGEAQVLGKPTLQDLARGQLTLPIIHALGAGSPLQVAALREALEQAESDPAAAAEAARLAEVMGGRKYAQQVAKGLTAEARGAIADLPPSPARQSLLDMTVYIIERQA